MSWLGQHVDHAGHAEGLELMRPGLMESFNENMRESYA
jgi:hypothetical protein